MNSTRTIRRTALAAGLALALGLGMTATASAGGPRTVSGKPSDAVTRIADFYGAYIDAQSGPGNGGKLAEEFANRRTDYAMVTSDPSDLANSASYPEFLDRMEAVFLGLRRVLRDRRYACVIVRDAYQAERGADFDIKQFHKRALDMGGVGLDTLRTALLKK